MDLLFLILGAVNGKGASVDKGTLEVVALILVVVLLVILIIGRGRWRLRP